MSVIWSGVTEEGAVVPVQVTAEGKVVAVGDGPEGEYLKLTGGNLTGDLTVNEQIELNATDGSASYSGDVKIGGTLPSAPNISLNADGKINCNSNITTTARFIGYDAEFAAPSSVAGNKSLWLAGSTTNALYLRDADDASRPLEIGWDGSATFAGQVLVDRGASKAGLGWGSAGVWVGDVTSTDQNNAKTRLNADGSASFAGGACGFTAEGDIFFTSRGTRYKLFVSQGLVQAEEYTRQMELKEKADKFIENKIQPRQPEVTPDNDNA